MGGDAPGGSPTTVTVNQEIRPPGFLGSYVELATELGTGSVIHAPEKYNRPEDPTNSVRMPGCLSYRPRASMCRSRCKPLAAGFLHCSGPAPARAGPAPAPRRPRQHLSHCACTDRIVVDVSEADCVREEAPTEFQGHALHVANRPHHTAKGRGVGEPR